MRSQPAADDPTRRPPVDLLSRPLCSRSSTLRLRSLPKSLPNLPAPTNTTSPVPRPATRPIPSPKDHPHHPVHTHSDGPGGRSSRRPSNDEPAPCSEVRGSLVPFCSCPVRVLASTHVLSQDFSVSSGHRRRRRREEVLPGWLPPCSSCSPPRPLRPCGETRNGRSRSWTGGRCKQERRILCRRRLP